MDKIRSVITATGSYIPPRVVRNQDFLVQQFYGPQGCRLDKANEDIVREFEKITGIAQRRYADENFLASDMACQAAKNAIQAGGIDKETLDYIIMAHNWGDVKMGGAGSDLVPGLAARVKQKLGIRNPKTVAYDLILGCCGWLAGLIQANYYIRAGDAKRILVIGADTLSRVVDPCNRDSMLFGDGAGAALLEAVSSPEPCGILSHAARSDCLEHAQLLWLGCSNNPQHAPGKLVFKMEGHKVFEYAVKTVPELVSECISRAGLTIRSVDKFLFHQANAKMNAAILKKLLQLDGRTQAAPDLMPMTISWLGNTSVASVPILLDLVRVGHLPGYSLDPGQVVVFAAVGAGMNVNAMVYKTPGRLVQDQDSPGAWLSDPRDLARSGNYSFSAALPRPRGVREPEAEPVLEQI